jgi:hypothetical protein
MKKIIKQEQWVMLPTEDESQLMYWEIDGVSLYKFIEIPSTDIAFERNHHLYLTFEREIKGGDNVWYIDKFTKKLSSSGGAEYGSPQDVVVATTNRKLIREIIVNKYGTHELHHLDISKSFIEYYVKKEGKVGDVEEIFHPMGDGSWIEYKPIEEKVSHY